MCLSQGFYSCTNITTKKQVGEERVYSVYTSTLLLIHTAVHHQGSQLKQVRKQELMQRPWRDVTYWLVSPGLLSLLSYRTKTTSPGIAPTIRGTPPPPSLLTAGSHGGISLTKAPFSVITPACVKLTQN
jgi:hypothetical protein